METCGHGTCLDTTDGIHCICDQVISDNSSLVNRKIF